MTYPDSIANALASIEPTELPSKANGVGMAVSFRCGSFVRFSICVNSNAATIDSATFRTDGCGYMLAAADLFSKWLSHRKLSELHGLNDLELLDLFEKEFPSIPSDRAECVRLCIVAIGSALAEYRASRVAEFTGDSALVCSCFGVSEDTIANEIINYSLETVDEVASRCNAGSGCGSCRMLIEELLSAVDNRGI